MAYRVEMTPQAERDLDEALGYIVDAAPEKAQRWFVGMMEVVCSLEEMPERASLAPESRGFGREIRQIMYGKRTGIYRIMFCIYESERMVRIICIRHGARDEVKLEDLGG